MTSHADTPSPQDPSPAGQSAPHTPSPHATGLLTRIEDRTAVVGVIGQGYVGLPLGLVFVNAGFRVLGFDVDSEKVARLERGDSYIRHIGPERVAQARSGEHTAGGPRFTPTTDFDRLAECDAVLICVPTPLGPHREPDLSYVFGTTREIAARLRPGQLVVLESTTYPGTTEEELRPLLEETGLRTGAGGSAGAGAVGAGAHPPTQNDSAQNDFFLAFSPEREDPGNPHFSTHTIPKLVGGVDPESTQVAAALYGAAATCVDSGSTPPTSLGMVWVEKWGLPGSSRSGRKARKKSFWAGGCAPAPAPTLPALTLPAPVRSPVSSSRGLSSSSVVPG